LAASELGPKFKITTKLLFIIGSRTILDITLVGFLIFIDTTLVGSQIFLGTTLVGSEFYKNKNS
jgi:hypothetical protein